MEFFTLEHLKEYNCIASLRKHVRQWFTEADYSYFD